MIIMINRNTSLSCVCADPCPTAKAAATIRSRTGLCISASSGTLTCCCLGPRAETPWRSALGTPQHRRDNCSTTLLSSLFLRFFVGIDGGKSTVRNVGLGNVCGVFALDGVMFMISRVRLHGAGWWYRAWWSDWWLHLIGEVNYHNY